MARTHQAFIEELNAINPTIKVIGQYTKAVERVKVECLSCHYIWSPLAYGLLQGKGCPHCGAVKGSLNNKGKTKRKSHIEFVKEITERNPNIEVYGTYTSNKSVLEFKCTRCGHIWNAKAYSVLQGHGCPKCAKSGTSFMEQYIYYSFIKVLGKENVLSRDRTTIGMELDILIPKYNFAIEPGNWILHKKNLKRDTEKRNRCNEKNIRLITIYDKYDEILPPFESDCFTFKDDLNKIDHIVILNLVYSLFDLLNITIRFSNDEIKEIEEFSYEHSKSMLHKDFVTRMNEIHPNIIVLGQYVNSNKRVSVECIKCGYQWDAVPASLLSGDGCRKCGTIKAHKPLIKDTNDFIEEISRTNPSVEIIGEYTGRHNPVKTKCKICGYIWHPIASSLLRGSSHKGAKTMHKNK